MYSSRVLYFVGFIFCSGLLASGYYIEFGLMVEPCPLCLLQRYIYFLISAIFLLGFSFKLPRLIKLLLNILLSVSCLVGIGLAGRQVWLQHLPPDLVPSCSAGLERLIKFYPLLEAISIVIKGTGECSDIDFTIFGLSLANWSLFCFVGLFGYCSTIIWLQKKGRV